MERDRNLLFGVHAVQLEYITATQFAHAAEVWATDHSKPLASYLIEDRIICENDEDFIEDLVEKAILDSDGSPEAALQKMGGDEAVHIASGGCIRLVDSSGISIRTPMEPQHFPHVPEPGLHAAASFATQKTLGEIFPWKQIGIVVTGLVLLLAFASYMYLQMVQDLSARERANVGSSAFVPSLLDGELADIDSDIGLNAEARFAAEEGRRHAERQRNVAEAQKTIAVESLMKLSRDMPARLIEFPETRPALREFLEEIDATVDRIFELEPDSDDLEHEKAKHYTLMASLWDSLGDGARSIAARQRALAITKQLAGSNPAEAQLNRRLAQELEQIGLAYSAAKDFQNAVTSFESSLDVYKPLLDAHPNDKALHRAMALTYNNLANTLVSLGQRTEAINAYTNSLKRNWNALVTQSVSDVASEDRLLDDAMATYLKTLEIFDGLMLRQPDGPALNRGLPYENLGLAYALHGQYDEAQLAFRQSLDVYQASSETAAAEMAVGAARVHSHQGIVYGLLGDYQKAQDSHAQSFEIAQGTLIDEPNDTESRQIRAVNSFSLGRTHIRFNEYETAEAEFAQMLEGYMHPSVRNLIMPTSADSIHPFYMQALEFLSGAARSEEALHLQESYVALLRYLVDLEPDNVDGLSLLAAEYVKFGIALRRASRIEEARDSFQSGLDIFIALASKHPEDVGFQGRIEPLRQRLARIDEGR